MPILTPHRLNSNSFKKLEIYETIVWKIPKVATVYELNEIYDSWKAYKNLLIFRQNTKIILRNFANTIINNFLPSSQK